MAGDSEAPKAARAGLGAALKHLAPWLVAAGILTFLLLRVPADDLRGALERTSLWQLAALTVAFVQCVLVADALAMWIAFRESIPQAKLRLGPVITVRGASYLLAAINYGAGQGGIIYFLKRHYRVNLGTGAGAVLLATGSFVIVVGAAVGIGVLAGAVPDYPELRWAAIAIVASLPVYLIVIAVRPQFLASKALLEPLFDAGVFGTLRVTLGRTLHLAILLAGHWIAMRLFGIAVPVEAAIGRLPVVFLLGALPISPSGLGTTQAAAVTLFAEFAPGEVAAAREAVVLAYSLSFQVLGTLVTAATGLAFLRRLPGETGQSEAFDSSVEPT